MLPELLPFFAGDIAGILAGVVGVFWWRSGLCLDMAGLIASLAGCRCRGGAAVSKLDGIAVFAAIAVFVAGGAANGWERAVETAAGARQAIGAPRHNVRPEASAWQSIGTHLRGLEPGEGVAVVIIADRIAVFAAELYGDRVGSGMGLGCITGRAALPFLPKTLPIFLPDVLPESLPLTVRVW